VSCPPLPERPSPRARVTIDSVPPGTYRLIAWQPRLGEKEQAVTVEAAKDAQVAIEF
jgi:hypothetical protein